RLLVERVRERLPHASIEQRSRAHHLRAELEIRRSIQVGGVEDVAARVWRPLLLRRQRLLEEDRVVGGYLDVAGQHVGERRVRVRREDDADAIDLWPAA